jgi:hypothetical protein
MVSMTDDNAPPDPNANNLVEIDRYGDPAADPAAVRMIEKESYERVIEGLRMAADAAMHLATSEPQAVGTWSALATKLDLVRRGFVQKAGMEEASHQRATEKVWSNPLPWRSARDRFREGLRQAAGGCRQLGVCFRMELYYSQMANSLEAMVGKMTAGAVRRSRGIYMPERMH